MRSLRNLVYRTLRGSEGLFKTDMVYLTKGGFWLTSGQVLATLAALASSVVLANQLDQNTYGIYKYILTAFGLLTTTNLLGINTSLTQSIIKNGESSIAPALREKIRWSFLGSLLAVVGALYYLYKGNTNYFALFALVATFLPFLETLTIYDAVLQARRDFRKSTLYSLLVQVVASSSLIVSTLLTENVVAIIAAFFGSTTLVKYWLYQRVVRSMQFSGATGETIIPYGRYLSLISALNNLTNYIDKLAIYFLLGPIKLAIYSIAIAPVDHLKSLLKGVKTLSFLKLAGQEGVGMEKRLRYRLVLLSLAVLLVSAVYIFIAPYLFSILFPKYVESIIYSQIFALSLFAVITAFVAETALVAVGAKRQITQYNLFNNLFGLVVLVIFIYFFGLWGAIAGRIVNRVTLMISGWWLLGIASESSQTKSNGA